MCRAVVDDEPRIHQQLENLTYEDVEDMEHSITELTGRNQETSRAIMTYIASQMARNGASTLTGHMEVGVRGIVTRYVSEIVHDFVHILGEFVNAEEETPVGVGDTPTTPVGGGTNTTSEVDNASVEEDQQMLDRALDLLWNYHDAVSEPAAQGDGQALSLRDYITQVREQLDSGDISRDEYDIISHEVRDAILADVDYQGWRQIQSLIFSEGEDREETPPYPPVGEAPTTPVRDTSTPLVRDTPTTPVRETPTTPVRVPEEIHAIDQLPAETLNYIDCIINTNFELNEINFLNELPEFQIINNIRN